MDKFEPVLEPNCATWTSIKYGTNDENKRRNEDTSLSASPVREARAGRKVARRRGL